MKPFPERNLDERKIIFNDRLTKYEEIHGVKHAFQCHLQVLLCSWMFPRYIIQSVHLLVLQNKLLYDGGIGKPATFRDLKSISYFAGLSGLYHLKAIWWHIWYSVSSIDKNSPGVM